MTTTQRVTLHGDQGQTTDALVKAIRECLEITGRNPRHLVIGVDLYERLVVNGSTTHGKEELYSVTMNYTDTFMGIPLVVVPDHGMIRAVSSPMGMLMRYGGRAQEGGAQR